MQAGSRFLLVKLTCKDLCLTQVFGLCISHDINIFALIFKTGTIIPLCSWMRGSFASETQGHSKSESRGKLSPLKDFYCFPTWLNWKKKKKVKGKGSGGPEEEQMTRLVSDSLLGTGQKWALAGFPGNAWTHAAPHRIPSCSQPIWGRLAGSFHPHLGAVMMWSRCVKQWPEARAEQAGRPPLLTGWIYFSICWQALPPSSLQSGPVLTDGSYVIF